MRALFVRRGGEPALSEVEWAGARKPCWASVIAPPLDEIKKTPGAATGVGVVGTKMRYPQK